jgi:hypothetical protein
MNALGNRALHGGPANPHQDGPKCAGVPCWAMRGCPDGL